MLLANSPGVEEEPAGEGHNEQDDGEVELELLILIFISKPAGRYRERLWTRSGRKELCNLALVAQNWWVTKSVSLSPIRRKSYGVYI